jgi:hypothetical protein
METCPWNDWFITQGPLFLETNSLVLDYSYYSASNFYHDLYYTGLHISHCICSLNIEFNIQTVFAWLRISKNALSFKITYPNQQQNSVTIECVAVSLGLSIVLVPIIGLLLYCTPWGIGIAPITFSLLALTITFAMLAILKQYKRKNLELKNQPGILNKGQ